MKLISRRSFLQGTGVVAAAAALTACGGNGNGNSTAGNNNNTGDYSAVLAEFDKAAEALGDWQNKFDPLIEQIRSETDFVKREALMHEAEDILMSTWALMPIYFYKDKYLQKEYVSNLYNNVFGMKRFYAMKNSNNNNASLNLNLGPEPDYVDPALTTSLDAGCLVCNLFLGLMTYDGSSAVVPGCAASHTVSEDGLVYTFTMRDNLKWSDGEKLDANDFVYSWNRVVKPETASDYSYMFDIVARNDDGTLKIEASADGKQFIAHLVAPCPYFLDLCAFPTFYPVPKKYVEAASPDGTKPGAWVMEAGFVTNGAYTMTSWKHGESIVFEANPNFALASEVTMPKLYFMLSEDITSVYTAFTSGDLDFASSQLPTDEMEKLKQGKELHLDPYLGTYYVCNNVKSEVMNAGRSVQQACALRKALCLAIDRDYIVETITQAGEVPANCFVVDAAADGHGGLFRENDDAYTYPVPEATGYFDPSADNTEEITTLLGAAGLVVGDDGMLSADTPLSFEYLSNPGVHVTIAESMQSDFASYGIDMTIDTQEWKVFLDTRKMGGYDIARNGWVMDFNDPINQLEMWTTKSGNNDAQFGK